MEIGILVISLLALLLAGVSALASIIAWVELRAFNKSTHNIQYVPLEDLGKADRQMQSFLDLEKDAKPYMDKDFDNLI